MKTSEDRSYNTKLELKHSSLMNEGNFVNKINNDNLLKNNITINYNDYELNRLNFMDAIKLDKRTYIQYYISLLKTKHLLIFTFYTKSDYNSKIIKIILFLFAFSLFFTDNALFFTDDSLHNIYIDKGKFNFIYEIPKILYSTIITSFLNNIIKFLSLTEEKISDLKQKDEDLIKETKILLQNFLIKFYIFFILVFVFMILFWYYLSCFCAVYINTQIHLIEDTLISFGLSLIYPLLLNLLPGIFRISALIKGKEKMYQISKILQVI